MHNDDVKREFFRKMGWCECTYCAELFYDYDDYVAHDCELQGVYPDGWEFTWCVTKGQPEMGSTAKKNCRVKNQYKVLTDSRW